MTKREAIQIDTSFYVEEDQGLWCVFGDNSGFAYSTHLSRSEALEALSV